MMPPRGRSSFPVLPPSHPPKDPELGLLQGSSPFLALRVMVAAPLLPSQTPALQETAFALLLE